MASLTVILPAPNRPPVPNTVADLGVEVGGTAVVTLTANDPDVPQQRLSFALVEAPAGATVTPQGAFAWSVPAAQPAGAVTIRATVTDDGTPAASTEFTFRVLVSRPVADQPPSVSAFEDVRIERNEATAWIPFTIGDDRTDVSALAVRAISTNTVLVPEGGIFLVGSGSQRLLMVRPAPDQSGETWITVSVTDGDGRTTERSFLLLVCPCVGPHLEVDLYAIITIHGESGRTYRVEYSETGEGNWRFLGAVLLTRTSQTYLDSSAPARSHRFYRVLSVEGATADTSETEPALVPLAR